MAALEPALRSALPIGADDAPANPIDEILSELSRLGVINVRRAHGNWTKPGDLSDSEISKVTPGARAAQPTNSAASGSEPAPGDPSRPARLRVPTAALHQDARLLPLLRDAVQGSVDEDGWARVGAVGTQIANKTSFDARNCGDASLTKSLIATQASDLHAEDTSQVAVRDQRTTRASASTSASAFTSASTSV